jgi:hypothetical protein
MAIKGLAGDAEFVAKRPDAGFRITYGGRLGPADLWQAGFPRAPRLSPIEAATGSDRPGKPLGASFVRL